MTEACFDCLGRKWVRVSFSGQNYMWSCPRCNGVGTEKAETPEPAWVPEEPGHGYWEVGDYP